MKSTHFSGIQKYVFERLRPSYPRVKSEIQEIIPIKKECFEGVGLDLEKRAVFLGRPGLAAHGVKTIGKRASKNSAVGCGSDRSGVAI